jgi:bacillithiol biosynthesis cysteine-adding enzyme BshC
MYKILHAIKLSEALHKELPEFNFVPVYYMGSEDADFAELNHTYVRGKKIEWQKQQTGSVGRMVVDDTLLALIEELESQLYFEPYAGEVIQLLHTSYKKGQDIQSATFELLNGLYGKYGLVVLMPDNSAYKKRMSSVFRDDLFNNVATAIIAKTSQRLDERYKVQATPREINLFYLKDNIRERIIQDGASFRVHNTNLVFSREEMEIELEQHPERFSPNVILRGLYQEKILPNIAFIGGGGELAYWLQLKDLFMHYKVPFPLLLLRNSFLIISGSEIRIKEKLQLSVEQLFTPAFDLLNQLIEAGGNKPSLTGELAATDELYKALRQKASPVDVTLVQHVDALRSKTFQQINALEKKLMRAERKKHVALDGKIKKLKEQLFPMNGLQERVENFSSFHAKWGPAFIDELLLHSPAMEQQFVVLEERVRE